MCTRRCAINSEKKRTVLDLVPFYGLLVFYRNIPLLHLIVLFDSHKWGCKGAAKVLIRSIKHFIPYIVPLFGNCSEQELN